MRIFFINFLLLVYADSIHSQVNLQNGSAAYEIPVFSFSDPKSGLSTSVSLNYSSGNGLVVSSKASNTGQNWNLFAGGAITRRQNGEADDQNSTSIFPVMPNGYRGGFNHEIAVYDQNYQVLNVPGEPYSRDYIDNYYPNGYMYSEFGLDMVEDNQSNWPLYHLAPREMALLARFTSGMDKKWKMSRRALADREQDSYIYSMSGISGEFVIGKDGNPVLINDAKIIIEKTSTDLTSQNILTRISEFIIKSNTGVVYKFSAYELAENMKFVELSNDGAWPLRKFVNSGEPTGKFTIQKWLLTEILNPITQEKITFEYENYDLDVITQKIPSYQFNDGQSAQTVQLYEQRTKGKFKRIKNIILPDGHKVEFVYQPAGTWGRVDVPDDNPLIQIKILYNNQEIDKYSLGYGYMVKKEIKDFESIIQESDKRFARLCLRSVQKIGTNISEPANRFDYYTGSESLDPKDIVPPFDCMAQDHWGYYNKSSIVNNDDPNPTKEILKDLMLNNTTYRQPSSGAAKLGLLKSVETPFGGKLIFDYEQNDSKDSDNPAMTKLTGGVRVFQTTVTDGISAVNDIVTNYNYKLADGNTSGWGYEAPTYLSRKEIKIWNASQHQGYTENGILKNNLRTKWLSAKAKTSEAMFAIKTFASIAGIFKTNPLTDYASFVFGKMVDGLFLLGNQTDYVWSNSYNFYPVESQNPIGVNYSRVEIANTSVPGGTGKIVNEFTTPVNVRAEIPQYVLPYSQKQRFPAWKYGLPLRTLFYNQSGLLLKEQINNYNIISNSVTNDFNKSCKVEVIRPESAWCWAGSTTNNIPLTDFSWEYYYPVTGRAEITSSIEKNYALSGIISQNEVSSTYNNDYLVKTTTTTLSNGDTKCIKNYYTNDFNNISAAIQEMKLRNMLAVPISTEMWLIKPNGNEYLLDATVNEFVVLTNGEVKIHKIYELENKTPLLKSLIGEHNPNLLIRNSSYFKEQLAFNFDNNGLLLETITPELKKNTKIFDYNDRVVTADIMNAARSEVAYSSFETDQKGSWNYDLGNIVAGEAVTGKKYFRFPQSVVSITRSVVSTKANRLSFWDKGGLLAVAYNGTPLSAIKSITNPVSGWTYKEYIFTGSGNLSISSDGISNADLDELRLHPADARMSTMAHDPSNGKITDCDVNNRLTYYEYDGLGRLVHVKDDRKNILKKICYNFAGEPENCINTNDVSPQWRPTGITRCQLCPVNGNFNSGVKENYEVDMNPTSPTYNTYRWTPDPTGSCPTPPSWVTTYVYCELMQTPPYGNTGNQITVQTDMNPCSPTYNQTQQISALNTTACPPYIPCNPACNEPQYKCINGTCVAGTWEVLRVQKLGKNGPWECTYVWCYPDGTYSSYSQIVTSSTPCTVTCF